jgi:predicted membrane protein
MNPVTRTNPKAQMVLGLLVVVIGLLFLVDNLGWIDLDFRRLLWPTALLVAGVLKLTQTRTNSGNVVGVILVCVGSIGVLRGIGFLDFDWRDVWPLVMIAAGIGIVYKAGHASKAGPVRQTKAGVPDDAPKAGIRPPHFTDSDEQLVNVTSVMGASNRRVSSLDFRGGEVTAILGSSDLDLRQASIDGEAVLNVFSFLGGITIKVPVDWVIVMEGTAILGGYEEKTAPPTGNTKRLIVRGYAILGGLEVRN